MSSIYLDGKSRRVRLWYENHVYRMYPFRILVESDKNIITTPTPRAKHLRRKADQHFKYGLFLGIPESEIKKFQDEIIKEVRLGMRLGRDAKDIVEILLEKNGQH